MSRSLFKRHLSHVLRTNLRRRKRFQQKCHKYVSYVYASSTQARTLMCLDPIRDLGGVPKDLEVPFFNLHNPLLTHQPMQEDTTMSLQEYVDQYGIESINPTDSENKTNVKTIFDHNQRIASYFRFNEFSANATQEPLHGFWGGP